MLGSQHPDKSAVGRKRTDSASASITEKSNLQLLNGHEKKDYVHYDDGRHAFQHEHNSFCC